jgi:hypothetical protein
MRGTMLVSSSTVAVPRSTSPIAARRFPPLRAIAALAVLAAAAAAPAHAQQSASPQTLVVNGQQTAVPVIQMKNRSYVDLDSLTRALGGSINYAGGQIALSLPSASAGSSPATSTYTNAPPPAATSASPPTGFSKGFMGAAIEEAATLREWHAALASAIKNGYPMAPGMFTPYRAQSQTNLRLVSVAIATDSDRNAYALLNTLFQNMSTLTDRYLDKRANMSYISPDSLENDGLNQSIVTCGHSLSAMAASGQFNDDGSCR